LLIRDVGGDAAGESRPARVEHARRRERDDEIPRRQPQDAWQRAMRGEDAGGEETADAHQHARGAHRQHHEQDVTLRQRRASAR